MGRGGGKGRLASISLKCQALQILISSGILLLVWVAWRQEHSCRAGAPLRLSAARPPPLLRGGGREQREGESGGLYSGVAAENRERGNQGASTQGWRQRKREGESGGLNSGVAAEKERGGIRGPVLRGGGRERERGQGEIRSSVLRGDGRDRERWNQEFCTQG